MWHLTFKTIYLSSSSSPYTGFIPAPIYFGVMIQANCLMRQMSCGEFGVCQIYDLVGFRLSYHGLMIGLKAISLVGFSISFWSVRNERQVWNNIWWWLVKIILCWPIIDSMIHVNFLNVTQYNKRYIWSILTKLRFLHFLTEDLISFSMIRKYWSDTFENTSFTKLNFLTFYFLYILHTILFIISE